MRRADEQDFHEFVVAASADLARLARLICADPQTSEDLVQSTLLKTWSAWPRVQRADNPYAYVRRVMVNSASKAHRRRWRGEVPTTALPEMAGPDRTTTVDDRTVLVQAVRQLPPRQRAAIVLRYFADLGDQDIAQTLGCSVATVRSQISRALATLRVSSMDDLMSSREST